MQAVARFAVNGSYAFGRPSQPAEIAERYFADPQRALAALKQGEVDRSTAFFPVILGPLRSDDRWSCRRMPRRRRTCWRCVRSILIWQIANSAGRWFMVRTASWLLSQGLLRGTALAGFRVVSGPFPRRAAAGIAHVWLRRANRAAAVRSAAWHGLVLLSENEVKATYEKQQKEAPKRTPLTLGQSCG